MADIMLGILRAFNRFSQRFLKYLFLLGSLVLLTQCMKVSSENHTHVNPQLASPYTMPATAYLALANNQGGAEKQSMLIMAAGRLIYDGQWPQGVAILSRANDLPPLLQDEKILLLAKVDLIRGQPRGALSKLATIQNLRQLGLYYQVQYHEMLASSYQQTDNPVLSVSERIKLDGLLPDEASKSNNRRSLWLTLTKLPVEELNTLSIEAASNSTLQGWIQLALISRKPYTSPQNMVAQLVEWKANFTNHAAQFILPGSLDSLQDRLFPVPKQIALLLPLAGPLAGPGNAVKDGFMAASDANGASAYTVIKSYNTTGANVASLYQRAIADGADYVVGPLSKADVALVANLAHPVPTLLLNDTNGSVANNAWQFGLSPSNEARQVASKARKNGTTRALVIAPAGPWGDEVVGAFSAQWRDNGGQVVDSWRYSPREDLNTSLRHVLHITDSEARGKQLAGILGSKVEAIPQRRHDFDMIFLVAYPSQARQIKPLLNYYYAGDVPVYATSAVYGGSPDSKRDRDLDGIIFCDMPWVFSHQMGARNWPEQFNSYNRLYALGMDSFSLSTQLNQLLLFPALGVNDKSGIIYLGGAQQISRILVFGQFRQGLAIPLSDNR
jgi:outer membrane PBP1 activator LpoA protein